MVENSLGRMWLNGHPNEVLKSDWKYYLEEIEQEENVKRELEVIKSHHSNLKIEDIKVIDPCMGSGHILVYAFEVLMQIYKENGYSERDAAVFILKNNLFGLDIDERAYQLSYFAVMMKARQYNRRVLTMNIKPQLYAFVETTEFIRENLFRLGELKELGLKIASDFEDAKELGSILKINYDLNDLSQLDFKLNEIGKMVDYGDLFTQANSLQFVDEFSKILDLTKVMSKKYEVIVTNPPYMGSNGMGPKLSNYVKNEYPNTWNDMSTICMEKFLNMCHSTGYMSMINIPSWMFISSYENFRKMLIEKNMIVNMLHFARGVFGSDFGTTGFVFSKYKVNGYKALYKKLFKTQGTVDNLEEKEKMFFRTNNVYYKNIDQFLKIPGNTVAYWISDKELFIYNDTELLEKTSPPRTGMMTADNNKFLRLWYEVSLDRIGFNISSIEESIESLKQWFPYNKGGDFRRWYGNRDYVVNWRNQGEDIYKNGMTSFRGKDFYFREGITWSIFGFNSFAARYTPKGSLFDIGGTSTFPPNRLNLYILALLNSKIAFEYISIVNPTVNIQNGDIKRIPLKVDESKLDVVNKLCMNCINISKHDWDSFETSWDFKYHPLITSRYEYDDAFTYNMNSKERIENVSLISKRFEKWTNECRERFNKLKANEEELNRIFINIYGLQNEINLDIDEKYVTVRNADLTRDIKSFISYAVGCMFGRYSLDKDGLIYAGGEWENSNYESFIPDKDNIIPICDDEYFEDDIVNRFVKFVETVYGKEALEVNLKFIANALNGKGTPRDVLRQYFLNDFFKDHCNTYQVTGSGKRPIYWLFDSGKKNGFKALVYVHRYTPDLIARMRTQYIHEQQARYRNQIEMLENQIDSDISTSERVRLNKKLKTLKEQDEELRKYEEKVHHWADKMEPMDFDEGVKANYAKFQELLAKIK